MMSGNTERRCRARTRSMAVVAVGAVVVWPAVVLAQAGHVGQGPIQPSSGAGHVGANPTTITTSPMPPSQPAVPPSTPPKPLPPIKRPIIIFYNGHYWWYPERTVITGTQQIVDPFVMPTVPAPSDLPQPPPAAPEPVKPLTPMEQAVLELSLGQWDRAIQVLESVLVESPRDARAMRLVSRALMGKSQMREAAAMMMAAYDLAPSLAMEPLPPSVVEGFADLRSRFVRFAEMDRSASAWLTCFVLVQAESGPAEAKARALRNYLDRAERSGLDARIGDALRKALGPVPSVRVATPTPVRVPSRSIRPEAEAPDASPSPQGNSPTQGGA
jgi:hypothetical protein